MERDWKRLLEEIVAELQREAERAGEIYRANRDAGSPAPSLGYDEGRRRGILDAIDIVQKHNHV